MKEFDPTRYKTTALHVEAGDAPWRQLFWWCLAQLLQPVLVPTLLIASKLLHRPFDLGVVWHDVVVQDIEVIDETPEA